MTDAQKIAEIKYTPERAKAIQVARGTLCNFENGKYRDFAAPIIDDLIRAGFIQSQPAAVPHREAIAYWRNDALENAAQIVERYPQSINPNVPDMAEEIRKYIREPSSDAILSTLGRREGLAARPLSEWHEDYGNVVWWTWQDGKWLGEPSYIGSPLCDDWPDYHTHWTPHPNVPSPPHDTSAGGG